LIPVSCGDLPKTEVLATTIRNQNAHSCLASPQSFTSACIPSQLSILIWVQDWLVWFTLLWKRSGIYNTKSFT
jgi:hypothetical protein